MQAGQNRIRLFLRLCRFRLRSFDFLGNSTDTTMKFMLLFQLDEKRWAELSENDRDGLMSDCDRYAQEMVASGHARHCAALHPSSTATTLRVHEGRRVVTDGPFAETKEVLAGCQIIECRNLDEAIEIAARFPPLRAGGSVEVRPIRVEGGPPTQPLTPHAIHADGR